MAGFTDHPREVINRRAISIITFRHSSDQSGKPGHRFLCKLQKSSVEGFSGFFPQLSKPREANALRQGGPILSI
jgi:hypothetical protein